MVVSDEGNEYLHEKHESLVGDDVIARAFIDYINVRPWRDDEGKILGSEIVQVL